MKCVIDFDYGYNNVEIITDLSEDVIVQLEEIFEGRDMSELVNEMIYDFIESKEV